MPKVSVFDMAGKAVSEIELSEAVFGVEPNKAAMHLAVVSYLANQRQGTQSTLTRTEVSGGGRKPWRQKGTGHARQGSTRAPQWTHGGIALGPKPRDYVVGMNKKVKRLALKSAFSSKVLDSELVVVDKIASEDYKTKTMASMLKALVVLEGADEKTLKSFANIPGVKTASVSTLNVYDVLNCSKFVVVKDAVAKIEEVYA